MMEKTEGDKILLKNRNANNNNCVFESPDIEKPGRQTGVTEAADDSNSVFEMINFASDRSTSASSYAGSINTDRGRVESEEFENISVSAVDLDPASVVENTSSYNSEEKKINKNELGSTESGRSENLEVVKGLNKRRGSSFESLKFEMAHDIIEEEDCEESVDGGESECVKGAEKFVSMASPGKVGVVKGEQELYKSCSRNETQGSDKSEAWKNMMTTNRMEEGNKQERIVGQGDEKVNVGGKCISLQEHYSHTLEMRRKSESAVGLFDRPQNNYRKHSSGDLHSRLKTRKLLGVGETDDGDVHRSKLSQILGHSDQLYIRLPSGLRLWQIILAVVLSVLSLWALLFPGHYFNAMYDMDGSTFTFPIRLYACALICISVMYWSTVQAADREIIRMILLSSIIFFTLQSCVMALGMITFVLSTTRWTVTLLGLQCVCAFIGYFFHCGLVTARPGCLTKSASGKDLLEKDQ